ncbi:HEXXH motif domain-containing protein [Streptomyces phaeofaciens JCM 4814]|uniref:HEXXH motif domain-containing protein n=1 Tax=Streptomyces phaeofaciens TaxID=68254 RepID=A0A918LXJ8_9ACTN|nr:HEXXH motif domain-containing protein [Streptomyces phaeofaciens]GGT64857.1 HEXXH motif domain-containing protein [Streptomyces phaeofaciens]
MQHTSARTPAAHTPTHHTLPPSSFHELLAGGGGVAAVDALCAGERSWRLLVVRAFLDAAAGVPAGPLPSVVDGWRLLVRAWEADARAAERVLAYPAVGVWAAHTLRRLRGSAEDDAPLWVHTGHLHALAASAAILAGLEFRTDVPVRHGWAVLPLVGAMRVDGTGWSTAEVAADGGRVTVAGRAVPGPGWHTPAELSADGCVLVLDDLDPYRVLRGPAAPEPLDRADDWRELFAGAWAVLRETGAEEAGALARGLSVVVPRPRAERFRPHSASSGDAFGAALASVPDDAEQFAATLVHEFQHNKLSALMHLFTLHEDPGTRLRYAPWRDDPRPLGGLLQGVYAFHGVTGFWRRRQHPLGRFEFALWRAQTAHALRSLADAEELTVLGRRLVAELSATLEPWLAEPVDARCRAAADLAVSDHRATWRAYHLRPDPRTVRAHAEALGRGAPPPASDPASTPAPTLAPGRPARGLDTRAVLLRRILAEPAGLAGPDVRDDPGAVVEGARPEDVALVTGRVSEALDAFRARIARGDGDPESWVGLGLAARATGNPAGAALLAAPELAMALYAEAGGRGRDPLELLRV